MPNIAAAPHSIVTSFPEGRFRSTGPGWHPPDIFPKSVQEILELHVVKDIRHAVCVVCASGVLRATIRHGRSRR
jgi:hypothetical protein